MVGHGMPLFSMLLMAALRSALLAHSDLQVSRVLGAIVATNTRHRADQAKID
jgi:hypothetical protein